MQNGLSCFNRQQGEAGHAAAGCAHFKDARNEGRAVLPSRSAPGSCRGCKRGGNPAAEELLQGMGKGSVCIPSPNPSTLLLHVYTAFMLLHLLLTEILVFSLITLLCVLFVRIVFMTVCVLVVFISGALDKFASRYVYHVCYTSRKKSFWTCLRMNTVIWKIAHSTLNTWWWMRRFCCLPLAPLSLALTLSNVCPVERWRELARYVNMYACTHCSAASRCSCDSSVVSAYMCRPFECFSCCVISHWRWDKRSRGIFRWPGRKNVFVMEMSLTSVRAHLTFTIWHVWSLG